MSVNKPTLVSVSGGADSFTVVAQSALGGDYSGLLVVAMGQRDGDIVGTVDTSAQGSTVTIQVTDCIPGQQYVGFLIQWSEVAETFFGVEIPSFAMADNIIKVFVAADSNSMRHNIMDAVDILLKGITRVAHFYRARPMTLNHAQDYPVLFYWIENDRNAMVDLGRQYKILTLIVGGWVMDPDPEDAIEQLMADVENVLLADPSLSGTAIDINIVDEELELPDDGRNLGYAYKTFAVLYDHQYADPRAA